jgi:hypothetical protein
MAPGLAAFLGSTVVASAVSINAELLQMQHTPMHTRILQTKVDLSDLKGHCDAGDARVAQHYNEKLMEAFHLTSGSLGVGGDAVARCICTDVITEQARLSRSPYPSRGGSHTHPSFLTHSADSPCISHGRPSPIWRQPTTRRLCLQRALPVSLPWLTSISSSTLYAAMTHMLVLMLAPTAFADCRGFLDLTYSQRLASWMVNNISHLTAPHG